MFSNPCEHLASVPRPIHHHSPCTGAEESAWCRVCPVLLPFVCGPAERHFLHQNIVSPCAASFSQDEARLDPCPSTVHIRASIQLKLPKRLSSLRSVRQIITPACLCTYNVGDFVAHDYQFDRVNRPTHGSPRAAPRIWMARSPLFHHWCRTPCKVHACLRHRYVKLLFRGIKYSLDRCIYP
jgi:hypothetical protein